MCQDEGDWALKCHQIGAINLKLHKEPLVRSMRVSCAERSTADLLARSSAAGWMLDHMRGSLRQSDPSAKCLARKIEGRV